MQSASSEFGEMWSTDSKVFSCKQEDFQLLTSKCSSSFLIKYLSILLCCGVLNFLLDNVEKSNPCRGVKRDDLSFLILSRESPDTFLLVNTCVNSK
jgi:hypothetical protein